MTVAFKKHIFYYFSLLVLLTIGVFMSTQIVEAVNYKILAVGISAALYIIMGITHHYTEHDLDTKIVVEYVLIGLLGFSIAWFFIKL